MLGTRGFRAGRKAVRRDDASTSEAGSSARADVAVEVLAEVGAQPQPLSSLAGAGVAAVDILPARSSRGLRRRRGGSPAASVTPLSPATATGLSSAPVSGASVATAFALPVPASGEIQSRPLPSGPGKVRPLGDAPTAELPTVPSLFLPPPAEVADGPATAAIEARVTASDLASGPTAGIPVARIPSARIPSDGVPTNGTPTAAVPNRLETEPVGAGEPGSVFAGPGRSAVEPEPALSSLFAPAPAAMATVAEIVPTAAMSAVPAAAAEAPSSLFAPAPDPRSETPEMPAPARVPDPVGAAEADAVATSALPVAAAAQSLRERSAMASEALSELSALSSYRPDGQSETASGRRAPQTTPASAAQHPVPGEEPLGARRGTRNAADVRSMLNSFRSDGSRTSAAVGRTLPKQASGTYSA